MRSRLTRILAAAALALPLTACTVKQTEEGKLPEYEVRPAEVQVSSTPVEVTVPDIDVSTEKKTVEVPTVEVTSPTPAPDASPPGGGG